MEDLLEQGNRLYQAGRHPEAEAIYRALLESVPEHASALGNLGAAVADQGRHEEAIVLYQQAIALDPALYPPWHNLGNSLRLLARWDEAEATARSLLARFPEAAEGHVNLGIALFHQRRLEEAEAAYRRAIQLDPNSLRGWSNLGLALAEQGRLDEALVCHDRAVQRAPDDPDAHRNRSLAMLLMGDLARGFPEYEWRWSCADFQPLKVSQPLWRGETLPESTLLVYTEQGLGDVLQFVRFAPWAKRRVREVLLVARDSLLPLLGRCSGVDRLMPMGSFVAGFDTHVPLLSLPAALGTSLASVPASVPYLFADAGRTAHWADELAAIDGLRVGVAWWADPKGYRGAERSIPLEAFGPLAKVPGVRLVSLQKGPGAEQAESVGPSLNLIDWGPRLDLDGASFEDTAAVMRGLDLVVTCDTAIAHLAGGLGVNVWVALPKVPDWRWLLHRNDSPWYPTMRLYRQVEAGDWGAPFAAMARDLRDLANTRGR